MQKPTNSGQGRRADDDSLFRRTRAVTAARRPSLLCSNAVLISSLAIFGFLNVYRILKTDDIIYPQPSDTVKPKVPVHGSDSTFSFNLTTSSSKSLLTKQHALTISTSMIERKANISKLRFASIPIVSSNIRYTERPTSHLVFSQQSLKFEGPLPVISLKYFTGTSGELKIENLYPFQNYIRGFEGAVTHLWISILSRLQGVRSNYIVIDGGMNVGFYTTLSAVMGFEVHSFELQLDCFDVANLLLYSNDVVANLYHFGISDEDDEHKVILSGEGCNPSYNVATSRWIRPMEKEWKRRKHRVPLISLDTFLEEKRKDRQIAILKLDIEGAEILALRGLTRHLPAVKNIVVEISPRYSRRARIMIPAIIQKIQGLQVAGFRPFLLWLYGMKEERWFDQEFLTSVGLKNVGEHPILGSQLNVGQHNTTMLWEVIEWNDIFTSVCSVGCNFLFSKTATTIESEFSLV